MSKTLVVMHLEELGEHLRVPQRSVFGLSPAPCLKEYIPPLKEV